MSDCEIKCALLGHLGPPLSLGRRGGLLQLTSPLHMLLNSVCAVRGHNAQLTRVCRPAPGLGLDADDKGERRRRRADRGVTKGGRRGYQRHPTRVSSRQSHRQERPKAFPTSGPPCLELIRTSWNGCYDGAVTLATPARPLFAKHVPRCRQCGRNVLFKLVRRASEPTCDHITADQDFGDWGADA